MAHDFCNTVDRCRGRHEAGQTESNRIYPAANIEACDVREPLIERRHRVPEIRFGATDTRMAAANRPVGTLVPAHLRAVLRGRGPLAAHLVEAMALAMRLIAPAFHILPGIEVRSPLTIVVDGLAIGKERTPILIERRPSFQGQVVYDQRGDVLCIGRTSRHVN